MDKTMWKFKFEETKRKVVDGAKNTGEKVGKFCMENPLLAGGIALASVKAISNGIRFGQSCVVSKRERDYVKRQEKTVWDPSTRHHWELKKPLTNQEWLNIEAYKRQSGKSLGEILREWNKLA